MLLNAFGDIDDLIPMMDLPFVGDDSLGGEPDEADGSSTSENHKSEAEEESGVKDEEEKGGEQQGEGTVGAGKGAAKRLPADWSELSPGAARARIAKQGRCSALIKVRAGVETHGSSRIQRTHAWLDRLKLNGTTCCATRHPCTMQND